MGAIDKNSFVWASLGIEPPLPEDAIYEAGEQPIAGFDNYFNWAISSDIDQLNDYIGNHATEHEAGGRQEIDIGGLSINDTGKLVGHATDAEIRIEDPGGTAKVRFDLDDNRTRAFPDFATNVTFREGATIASHLYRNNDQIYDYNNDIFHRAEEALEANYADLAGDSELLDGSPASAFIREDDASVAPTGNWDFTEIVDADISGHADSATLAYEAEFANHAEKADLATDSNHLEGYTVNEILNMVSGDIEDSFPAVDDDGAEQLSAATRFDFGQSIDVDTSGSTAEMSVDSVPHADEAEYSYNSNRLNNYKASDLIAMMGDGGRWNHILTDEVHEADGFSWFIDLADAGEVYDFYRLSLVHEFPHDNKTHRAINCQLNRDTRQRYQYRYSWYVNDRVDHTVENGATGFPLCNAPGTKRAMAEYQIWAPRRIGSSGEVDNEDIYVGRIGNGVYPKTRPLFHHGAYTTSGETLNALHLYTNNHEINLGIELWGRNLQR